MYGQPDPTVVIAGDGVAATTLACLLRDDGFGVVLLTPRRRSAGSRIPAAPVIEAIPEATVRLLADVGLAPALAAADAVTVHGFDNAYRPDAARTLDGVWTHLDRVQLARECLRAARRRGATVLPATTIGPPTNLPRDGVQVPVGETYLHAMAAVDATGRAARWSRPITRSASGAATLYTGPGRTLARSGRIARVWDGWAYRLDHPQATTIGVIRRRSAAAAALDGILAGDLGIDDPELFVRVGIRPATVQWSSQPVAPCRLAIGDAALALSPIAGQGLRFAISSALAAAAVLRTWNDGSTKLASDYYRCFVDGVRSRHLAKLTVIAGGRSFESAAADNPNRDPLDPDRRLRWVSHVEHVGINRGGRIVADKCCVLPDGGLVRWIGGFDVLLLRDAVASGRTAPEIGAHLTRLGVADTSAQALLAWAIRVGAIE
jgi:2-polyprenyl-6-methoxyphenol hydroxylase-like FAD-dependent oxidoreductase